MDESSDAGPSRRQVDGDEVDADWIKLIKTNHDVNVRVSDRMDLAGLPQECNLMVVSNSYDLLVVGGNQDVRIHRLSEVHKLLEDSPKDAWPTSTPLQTLSLSARPIWIRLAMGEERLVVALADGRGFNLYRLSDILGGNTNPYHIFSDAIPHHLLDVLPNPAPPSPADQLAQYTALLSSQVLIIVNLETCQLSAPLPGPFTSASWSAKGKQIALGVPDGRLVQYTPGGTPKAEIPPPTELEQSFQPVFIRWLENDVFLVCYANPSGQLDDPVDPYIIHRHQGAFTYTKFFDPNDVMGVPGRSSIFRHFASLKSWGEKTKHLGFMISGLASEIGILHGHPAAPAEVPKWEVLILDETARGVMPAGKGGAEDTSVIGLDLDLTTTKPVVRGIQGGIELDDLPPLPRIIAYSQEGFVVSFNVQYPDAGSYPGMIKPLDLPSVADGADAAMETGTNTPAQQPEPTPAPTAPNAFGSSGFGQSAFGASTTPQKAPAFRASTFGQSTTPAGSPFTSTSQSITAPSAFGQSAFGQSATSTTPTTTPAKLPTTSAFGQSATGQSSTSAFGQSSTPAAFGQSSFGQSSKPAFGSSAFGSSSTPSFGQSTFGQTAGSSSTPSAFGQISQPSSSPSAFGSSFASSSQPTSSAPAFGQSAFGQPSKPTGFGQSAFGLSSQPSSGASAFGSSPTSLGFGAFSGSKPAPGFGFAPSAFGQSSKPVESPSVSPFGGGGSASAFGSTSAFGAPSASSTSASSAFSGFGQKATTPQSEGGPASGGSRTLTPQPPVEAAPTPPPAPPTPTEADDFGLGAFASALESSKGAVPPLEESPPTSPTKLSGKPPGLEDDTPPGSPEFKSVSAFQPKPAATSSSFIKPATAFGGTSSGFGAFGSQTKAPSTVIASGSTSRPNALSSTPTASTSTSTSPSAFGSSAFGKTSTPAAFGQSTFGQSSKPIAPAAPAQSAFGSSTSSGNMTGGFGAFASKPSTSTDGKPAFGGFGGFASAGLGGKSAFDSAFGASTSTSSGSIFGSSPKAASPTKSPDQGAPRTEAKISPLESGHRPLSPVSAEASPPESSAEHTPDEQAISPSVSPPAGEASPSKSEGSEDNVKVEEEEGESQPAETQAQHEEPQLPAEASAAAQSEPSEDEEDQDAEGEYEDEDDEWDEEEVTDEDEAADEDDEGSQARRASSSIEPELPSIEEEDETDEEPELVDARKDGKTLKSPPPWFAKSTPEASPSTSLFSRLGSPPAQPTFGAPTMKTSSSFNPKHAARTSSPLGTQPPTVAGSTTPPGSPAKPLPPSSGFFEGQTGKQTSLGLGKLPAVVAPTPTTSKLPFAFGKPAEPKPLPTPTSVKLEPTPPPVPSTFTIPARSSPTSDPPDRDNGQKSMAAVLERMILELSDDIASIQALLESTEDYHTRFKIPGFAKITSSNLGTHPALPFSSLADIPDIVDQLSASLKGITEQNALASDKLAELQSRSMKIDLKTGQVNKYLEARNDPQHAARLRNDLTDEQTARRDALQETIDDIGYRMEELERSLDILVKRVKPPATHTLTDGPKLEEVQQSYRKVEAAIRNQEENIDDLADRISSIRFTTPARSRTREMSGTPGPLARQPRHSSATPSRPTPEFVIPENIIQEVESAKQRREALQSRLKDVKATRVFDASSLQPSRGAKEPVNMDSLPEPGAYVPEADTKTSMEDPKAPENSTTGHSELPSSSGPAPPTLSFSGISFNLDPGALSTPATRSGGSTRGGAGSRRTHEHAPKLQPAKTDAKPAPSSFGDFSLPTPPEKKDGAPSGFFSFSGFGK